MPKHTSKAMVETTDQCLMENIENLLVASSPKYAKVFWHKANPKLSEHHSTSD
jgi:hypothetical protein